MGNETARAPAIPPPVPPVVTVAWVMEPEIPRPEGIFLQFPTSRCFMEDRVDARVFITDFTMTSAASVTLKVTRPKTGFDEKLIFVSNDGSPIPQAQKDFRFAEQRNLLPFTGIGLSSENDGFNKILFEVSPTGVQATSIATSFFLPIQGESDVEAEYVFEVTIVEGGVTLTGKSAPIKVVRWWANPSKNMGFKPTNESKIEPLADGEAVFARCAALIKGAADRVLIASWSYWLDTFLSGIPGPGSDRLRDLILAAAGRGVKVRIMLDAINGPFIQPVLQANMAHPNILVKISAHHHVIAGRQIGTFHEKYLIADGKTAVVGGIDFEPDRFNSNRHNFKPDFNVFKAQAAAVGKTRYTEPFFLWHDSCVLVEGSIVPHLENDFGRRWNDAQPPGNDLPRPSLQPTAGGHNVQVVKTDHVVSRGSLPPPPFPNFGTFDAYKQAIAEARHYIYIENQYLNCKQLADELFNALQATPTLQLIAIIPFNTEEARYIRNRTFPSAFGFPDAKERRDIQLRIALHGLFNQALLVKRVRSVPNAGSRVGIFTLAGLIPGQSQPEEIYPHSKVMIVDDTCAIIGSANTNGRGFHTDGEMNVVIHRRPEVTAFRKALWKEHLGVELDTRKIRDFFKEWDRIALPSVASADLVPLGPLATQHAVKLSNPPPGQEYNGNFSFILNADDEA